MERHTATGTLNAPTVRASERVGTGPHHRVMSEQITPAVAAAVRVVSGQSLRELRALMLEVDPGLRVSPSSILRWESGLTDPRPRHRRAWHRVIEQLLADMEGES